MHLILFQPDIPQNAGTMIRLAACLNVPVDIIEPCGFVFSDRHFRRAGLDYRDRAKIVRHQSWEAFSQGRQQSPSRLILLTTKGDTPYMRFEFKADDALMVGRESSGVPDDVAARADARLVIPLVAGARSLNVAVAAAMVLGEALRQTGGFTPHDFKTDGLSDT